VDVTGESAGGLVLLLFAVGTALALFGVGLVQAATVSALVEIDEGRPVTAVGAYRLALGRVRPLLGALGIAVAVWVVLSSTGILLVIAIWLVLRWSLLVPVVELEGRNAVGSLRRSADLVRGRWIRVASLVGVGTALALVAGPLAGALLIVLSDLPFSLLNVVAGIVYTLAVPFVALATAYVYLDARVREELAPEHGPEELPAEIALF
jgi:hypothetical protein